VSEWLKELAWKASGRAYTCLVGSNPTLSVLVEWKQKRGWLNRALEKVEDLPVRAFS
jgi:hypothetical protein